MDEILTKIVKNFDYTSDMNSNEINNQNIDNSLNTLSIDDFTNDDTTLYTQFTNTFKSNISSSYDIYLSSLGIGGYANAPESIKINLYGNTYKFLDVTTFEDEIPTLRATFLSFGYLQNRRYEHSRSRKIYSL